VEEMKKYSGAPPLSDWFLQLAQANSNKKNDKRFILCIK
jgi:hypothetical protein